MTSTVHPASGADLETILRTRGPVGVDEARAIFLQLCYAVSAAHDAGSVHGDIEPRNVLLADGGQESAAFTVRVLDEGVVATPAWRAPEQTEGSRRLTPPTDVWALGLIAFALLTGRSYWRAASDDAAVLREVMLAPLPSASVRAEEIGAPSLPLGFDAWFARCVVRDVAARFRDAREVGAAFDALLVSPRDSSPTIQAPRSRRFPISDAPGPRRILVIDDDPTALHLIGHHLRRAGYEVVTASTGEEGLESARLTAPTLILLDFMLPDIDGPEVLQRLRVADATRDVPVILLTATELAAHIAEGFRAGANDYLMKPVDPRLLTARIAAAIATHDRARRATVIAVRHQKLVANLEEARAEQEVTLSVLPAAWSGWWAVGGVAPSGMVGGDFIAIYAGSGGERTAVVVDVAGHGAGAALVGASVRATLGHLLRRHELADAVAALNEELTGAVASRHACLAAVQVKGSAVTILNAGLPPVCVSRGGEPLLDITSSGVPPGLFPDQVYATTSFKAEPGDRIAVVSDGLVEPFGFIDEALPILRDLGAFDVERWTGHEQPVDVADLLRDELARVTGPQPDDATLLLMHAGLATMGAPPPNPR